MATRDIAMQLDVKVPMRDGVLLSADIYRPRGAPPVPAVLIRTPYSNNTDGLIEQGRRLAAAGYACVIQDCRGALGFGRRILPVARGPRTATTASSG